MSLISGFDLNEKPVVAYLSAAQTSVLRSIQSCAAPATNRARRRLGDSYGNDPRCSHPDDASTNLGGDDAEIPNKRLFVLIRKPMGSVAGPI